MLPIVAEEPKYNCGLQSKKRNSNHTQYQKTLLGICFHKEKHSTNHPPILLIPSHSKNLPNASTDYAIVYNFKALLVTTTKKNIQDTHGYINIRNKQKH